MNDNFEIYLIKKENKLANLPYQNEWFTHNHFNLNSIVRLIFIEVREIESFILLIKHPAIIYILVKSDITETCLFELTKLLESVKPAGIMMSIAKIENNIDKLERIELLQIGDKICQNPDLPLHQQIK